MFLNLSMFRGGEMQRMLKKPSQPVGNIMSKVWPSVTKLVPSLSSLYQQTHMGPKLRSSLSDVSSATFSLTANHVQQPVW